MNKLLATLNGIEQGTIKGTAQKQTGAMKKILESFDAVQSEACGAMPSAMGSMPQREGSPVSMNISLNASGKENVDELMSLLKSAGLDGSSMPKSMSMPAPAKTMPMALAMDTAEMEEEGFSNSPDEEYSDTEYMTKDLSGGINGQKKMYKPAAKGDNPMAVESIKERLWAALSEKKAKPDFLDIDKDGNKKEPMKKAVADKDNKEDLDECGEMGPVPGGMTQPESSMNINTSLSSKGDKSVNVTATGQEADKLMQLLKLAGIGGQSEPHSAPRVIAMSTDGEHAPSAEVEMEEEYGDTDVKATSPKANSPRPEYGTVKQQMQQGADLNRPKAQYKHNYQGGDNPMGMREETMKLESRLAAEYEYLKKAK